MACGAKGHDYFLRESLQLTAWPSSRRGTEEPGQGEAPPRPALPVLAVGRMSTVDSGTSLSLWM